MSRSLTNDQVNELRVEFGEDLRTGYSGRAMYGKTCIGYTGEDPVIFTIKLAYLMAGGDISVDELIEELEDLGAAHTDSMGRGTIYYWPHVQAEEGDDE